MDTNTKAILMLEHKTLEQINELRAEAQAIKEALILLLKAQTNFPTGQTPENFMEAVKQEYLSKTKPILDKIRESFEK